MAIIQIVILYICAALTLLLAVFAFCALWLSGSDE